MRCSSRTRQGLMAKKCCYNNFCSEMFSGDEKMKTREGNKLDFFAFLFKTALFGHTLKKNQHVHFLVHAHSSWSTFGSHLTHSDPKAL